MLGTSLAVLKMERRTRGTEDQLGSAISHFVNCTLGTGEEMKEALLERLGKGMSASGEEGRDGEVRRGGTGASSPAGAEGKSCFWGQRVWKRMTFHLLPCARDLFTSGLSWATLCKTFPFSVPVS